MAAHRRRPTEDRPWIADRAREKFATVRYSACVTWQDLRPFAAGPPAVAVSARAARADGVLTLDYRLDDPWGTVRLAPPAAAVRADRLWEHTCFEAFVAPAGGAAYWEVNLASDGRWNVWRFDRYREGMMAEDRIVAPAVETTTGDGTVRLSSTVDLSRLPDAGECELAVGLAVVVEATDGALSYWAVCHPGARPDFHARDGFSLRLPRVRS
jgi:hypothetical protein